MNINDEKEFMRLSREAANTRDDPFLAAMVEKLFAGSSLPMSNEVETICITRSKPRHLIRVSRDFLDKYVTTPDDVLFLLLHEMAHKFSPDFSDLPGQASLDADEKSSNGPEKAQGAGEYIKRPLELFAVSMIEDIMVNARLCSAWFPMAAPMFLKIYDIGRFPDILMVPPVLLDWYRGRVLDLDPFYVPPVSCADFDFNAMLEPEWHNRIMPVFDQVENLPDLSMEPSKEKEFRRLDDEHYWVKGWPLWYWKAWSVTGFPGMEAMLGFISRLKNTSLLSNRLLGCHPPDTMFLQKYSS